MGIVVEGLSTGEGVAGPEAIFSALSLEPHKIVSPHMTPVHFEPPFLHKLRVSGGNNICVLAL